MNFFLGFLPYESYTKMFYLSGHPEILPAGIRYVNWIWLAKYRDDLISINKVMTSQIIRHEVKIGWRYISVKNDGIFWNFVDFLALL